MPASRCLDRDAVYTGRGAPLLALLVVSFGVAMPLAATAQPGTVLFYNNLNGNLNDFTVVASGGDASVGNETSNQGRSLRLRWGAVRIYTKPVNAAKPGAELSLWIRRGDDSFSEDPDAGEDLVIEYRNAAGTWITIDTYDVDGTPGEIYTPTYTLPAAALHGNLSIQLRLTGGNGSDNDYWHIDDIRVTETASAGGPPFGIGTCERFDSGLNNWIVAASGGDAGISTATSNSTPNALFTRWGVVSVTGYPIDLSASTGGLNLDIWVRRGDDSFSENPEAGEDLVLEYFTSAGGWSVLETFPGNGTAGEIFSRSYPLPANALHSGFRVRLRQLAGSGSNNDYWHVDDVCLSVVEPVYFDLDETSWTGASGEVLDASSYALTGTAFGGATNAQTSPAIATNPGTCRYADFDGIDDYIEVPDAPPLDLPDQLTVAAWVNMRSLPSELHTIVSKDTNYEFHIDTGGHVYWWWNDTSGNVRSITTAASISLNQWHHIAISYRSGSQTLYVDGAVWGTQTYTGTLLTNDLPFYIGTDWNFIARAFHGLIDEVYAAPLAYSQAQVQALRDATHPCASVGAAFTINHDNFGIHCLDETITVDVIDAIAGTPLTSYNAQVELDTGSGNGTWARVSGSGTFVDPVADDGRATYLWPLGESQAQFALSYPQGTPSIDVDVEQVSDPGIRDTDAEGMLVFSPSGFTLTANPLGNPPPATIVPFAAAQTAGSPFAVYLTAYGQTPNDPVCGVIEGYAGSMNLKFWSSYLNPGFGSRSVDIDGVPAAATEAAAAVQPVLFTNGQATISAKYKDVGSLQLLVKDDTTVNAELPNGITGATAGFVSRPADFELTDIRNAAGTIVNPQAVNASGPVFVAAGADFRATVTALDAEGDPTPNFGREATPESVRLDVDLVAPVGGDSPAIAAPVGFSTFVKGSATGSDFSWREVGIIRLRPGIGDADYLGAGDVIGNVSENIGRFVPSHFALAPNTPMFATQCTAGSFTYTGAPFNYLIAPQLTATAQATAGSTTLNYTGAFFRMSAATLANRTYTSATGTLDLGGVPGPIADPLVAETGPGIATLTFSGGTGFRFARGLPDAPFDAEIRLSIDVLDADNVAGLNNPAVFGASSGIDFSAGTEIRYGRIRFGNAVGSELVNLPVPLRAEYFAGPSIGFIGNADDVCTTGVTLGWGAFTENLNLGDTCALDNGAPGVSGIGCAAAAPLAQRFSVPPTGGDFRVTLAAPNAGNSGSVRIDASVPAWLRFDWNAAVPGDENPSGTAAFGLFDGENTQIYIREVY